MSFAPYLVFPGTAREAMTFYAQVFGATDLQIMGFDAMAEAQRPKGSAGQVMHAQFSAGPGAPLLGSDDVTGMETARGGPTVFHAAASKSDAEKVYIALSANGDPYMPLAPTFWSPAFGMLRDRFGTTWMVTVEPGH